MFQVARRQAVITNTTFQLMNESSNDNDTSLTKMHWLIVPDSLSTTMRSRDYFTKIKSS